MLLVSANTERVNMTTIPIGLGVILLGLMPFSRQIYTWLAEPLVSQLPNGQSMIATNPAGAPAASGST